jgi:hypothetical protein
MLRDTALLLTTVSCLVSAQTTASSSLSVFLSNPGAASPAVTSSMRTELRELLRGSGFSFSWYNGAGNVEGRLAVIRLQGACGSDAPNPLPLHQVFRDPEALGSTHVSNGEVLPFADIRCDHLRRFVAQPLANAHAYEVREEMLGRALARVIAHELFHILLRTKEHGRTGLARAGQTAAQLVAPRLNFAAEDTRRLSTEASTSSSSSVADDEAVAVAGDRRN